MIIEMYDLAIIGGGINGTGIAVDAATRGLKVFLCEQNDLASGTSSRSSKLIHGGLRYLEHFDFLLVRKALHEREILYRKAPHLIKPMRFAIPCVKGSRPAWMVRIGLGLYDHLYHSKVFKKSVSINTKNNKCFIPLKESYTNGFMYSDAWVDDARLVIANALAARDADAKIVVNTRFLGAKRGEQHWHIELESSDKKPMMIEAKAIVNASGPWLDSLLDEKLHYARASKLQLVRGSHIVCRKFYDGNHAYLLQHDDGRVVFVMPYYNDFNLIGTTEVLHEQTPEKVSISVEEEVYLLDLVNHYFKQTISTKDIVHRYAGVRPLLASKTGSVSTTSRDYQFEMDVKDNLPLLNILGGKVTTYRKLSQQAVDKLKPYLPEMLSCQTADSLLPGAVTAAEYDEYCQQFTEQFLWLDKALCQRYLSTYGQMAHLFLQGCENYAQLGQDFGHGLYQVEVDYLMQHEWAQQIDDILWRRTKLGLYFSFAQAEHLRAYVQSNL